jgi:hypothetical protein
MSTAAKTRRCADEDLHRQMKPLGRFAAQIRSEAEGGD